jgi:hypothetical protein
VRGGRTDAEFACLVADVAQTALPFEEDRRARARREDAASGLVAGLRRPKRASKLTDLADRRRQADFR